MENLYLEFWTDFITYTKGKNWNIEPIRKARDIYYYDLSFGESGVLLSCYFNKNTKELFTGVYVKESHISKFIQLQKNRNKIEKILGYVKWVPDTGKGVARIKQAYKVDISIKANWEEAFNWLGLRTFLFKEVVKLYLQKAEEKVIK